jgi:hypothetical protein
MIAWQGSDIEAADVLETLGVRHALCQLQSKPILPLINVSEHTAVVNQPSKVTAAASAQCRNNKIEAKHYHLIDAVAPHSIDGELELVAVTVHVDAKLSRYAVKKARIFSEQRDGLINCCPAIIQVLLQERSGLADVAS